MTHIGFVGLGKLGLPCALAIESKGFNVKGYDIVDKVLSIVKDKKIPYQEKEAQQLLNSSHIEVVSLKELVEFSDILFVAVQTPHQPLYEGATRLPQTRVDFDYTYLKNAILQISDEVDRIDKDQIVSIISTVLPGTIEREILPIMSPHIKLCYNPFFIAMGTVVHDFLHPEFVLLGVDDEEAAQVVFDFYSLIIDSPIFTTTIKNAEAIKVFYNTFITSKIVFINTIMEICHKTGCDVDEIASALSLATDRIISNKYLRGGMGDGCGCHPRDNIALSWLAGELDLSYDLFGSLITARELHTEWLATLIRDEYRKNDEKLNVIILGKACKAEINITTGSPSILLKNILNEMDIPVTIYDPYIPPFDRREILSKPAIFFIGTQHKVFEEYIFPPGSIVIDPWRYIPDQKGVNVISIGEGK